MAEKKQYLKITKPDKTVHFCQPSTMKKLQFQNTLKRPEDRYHLEIVEMTKDEITSHSGYDETFAPTGKGDNALVVLKKQLESAGGENAELKKQIAELEAKADKVPPVVSAAQLVVMIDVAGSIEEVDELVGDDTRVSVIKAADKRKAELTK